MSPLRRRVETWFPSILGCLVAGSTLVLVALDDDRSIPAAIGEGALALVLSLGVAVVGYRYYARSDLPEAHAGTVARWTVTATGLVAALVGWFGVLETVIGEVTPLFAAITAIAVGMLGGTTIGILSARVRKRQADRRQALEEYAALFESATVGIFVHDPEDGRIRDVNPRGAELLGYEPAELEGLGVGDITADVSGFDAETARHRMQRAMAGDTQTYDWLAERADGSHRWVEVSLDHVQFGDETQLIAFVRDISDRKARERRLQRAEQRFRSLAENTSLGVVTIDETSTVQYANSGLQRLLGHDPDEVTGESLTRIIPDRLHEDHHEALARYVRTGEKALDWSGIEFPAQHADGHEVDVEVSIGELSTGDEHLFTGIIRDISDRKRREGQLTHLHDATREMIQAPDRAAACETAVQRADDVLELSVTGIWLVDDAGERLEPVASTEAAREMFDAMPTFTAGNSLSWRAFETGEARVIADLQDHPERHNPETALRSELIIPIGEYGVMNVGSVEPDDFTDNDLLLARLLVANLEVTLERTERERRLERYTERMEFFNSILRHDVLNGITVIKGRARFLADDLEGEPARDAETIIEWADDIEAIIHRVSTVLETLTGEAETDLHPVEVAPALRTELDRVESTYPDVTVETRVPDGTKVLANDLLGEVLGNVLTNAVDHNDPADLHLEVSAARPDGDRVVVRIADDGSGVPDDQEEAIFGRSETGAGPSTGSGFGLFFVDAMLAEYGGDVAVEDNDRGGATFVLEFRAADAG